MSVTRAPEGLLDLEAVISTAELSRRPSRATDHVAENRALVTLAQAMATAPNGILQKLAETALTLCRAHSAGLSIVEDENGEKIFRWQAAAGQWAPLLGGTMPRDFSPCGTVLDRNTTELMTRPDRHFLPLVGVSPRIEELLLIPFRVGGETVGTIWLMAHDESRRFDAEDLRVMTNLGNFAAACLTLESLNATAAAHRELEQTAAALRESQERLSIELADMLHLQDISTQLLRSGDVDALYHRILDAAIAVMRSDMASMQMLHRDRGELRLLAWKGFHPASAAFWETVDVDSGSTCGASLRRGERVIAADIETCDFVVGSPDFDAFRRSGIRAVQSTPLVSREGLVLGMLSNHWRQPHSPSERDLRMLDVLARHAADLIERVRAESFQLSQTRALEMLATGAPLVRILNALIRAVEERSDGLFGSILVRRRDGRHFCLGVAPSLPESFVEPLREASILPPYLGPCGMATDRGERVITADIADDPRWAQEWRDLALAHGLRSCHSAPILAADGIALGSFGLYCREPRGSDPLDLGLIQTATHLAGIAIERRQAEEALEDADRRKDEFLATLAHELRNPLSPITNGLEALKSNRDIPEAFEQTREMMARQVAQMVRLINDLLDVNRIGQGKIALKKARIELATVIEQVIETCRPAIEQMSQELTVSVPAKPIYLSADAVRLSQVISNLLSNASKFTPSGGRIRLGAERVDDGCAPAQVLISVKDTGIGIPEEALPRIFELFTQVDHSLERSQGGLGIGLTLAQRLTEMHGGTVEARSDGAGQGSEFIVRLPVLVDSPRHEEHAAEPSQAGDHRILVVDDNRDAADSLAALLSASGNRVRVAYDGIEAVDAAAAFRPDVVLLDIGMPKLNGYEAARRIRERPGGKDMVLIALTGWGQTEDRRRSEAAGFDAHLVKPVEHAALMSLLAANEPPGSA